MGLPLLDALPLDRARAVVDIGAGVGALFPHLRANAPQASLTGTDISNGMLRLARSDEEARLAVMDAQALAFADASFDTAILMFMLFHIPDPASALSEVTRVTRPGGIVGITT